jgi:hypothetical protein
MHLFESDSPSLSPPPLRRDNWKSVECTWVWGGPPIFPFTFTISFTPFDCTTWGDHITLPPPPKLCHWFTDIQAIKKISYHLWNLNIRNVRKCLPLKYLNQEIVYSIHVSNNCIRPKHTVWHLLDPFSQKTESLWKIFSAVLSPAHNTNVPLGFQCAWHNPLNSLPS